MTKQQLNSEFDFLVSSIESYLRCRINESEIASKFISGQKVIPVSIYDYTELTILNGNLIFLDSNGYHYSLYAECELHDLIDIVNSLKDNYPEVINDELNNYPESFKVTGVNSAKCGHIEYFWKSPSRKGDTFYGWVKCG